MDYLRDFVIPFVGLSNEEHKFEFLIDDKFFASFEYSEIEQAKVKVDVNLNKSERMMVLTFSMLGVIRVTCSRCLDEFDFPVAGEEVLYIKFGSEYKEEDDDVIIIPESETQINLAPFIYDYLSLMVPFRVVHPDNENGESQCDPDVIRRIEEKKQQKDTDPRWDKLKDLNLE
ncbi:MAG TPA: DUF177 domain-containing protein [Lentimicrobium sp.]|nr:DUF177 domain-containing protein [Lentimicrobium sp.]